GRATQTRAKKNNKKQPHPHRERHFEEQIYTPFFFWPRFDPGPPPPQPRSAAPELPERSRSTSPQQFRKSLRPRRSNCRRRNARALARYRSELRAQAGQSCAEFRAFGRRESSGRGEVASAAATAHERDAAAETLWLYQVQEPGAHRQSDDSHDRRYVS